MAMDLVTGAAGSLISKFGKLLKEEHDLQKGVPEKISSLIKELECAKVTLKKVAGVPPEQLNDDLIKLWAGDVREATYDMEDVLDTFLVSNKGGHDQSDRESLLQRLKEGMSRLYNTVVCDTVKRRKIATTIDDIKKRLEEAKQRCGRYTVDSIIVANNAATSTVDPRLEAMYKEVAELVGIDKPSAELTSMMSLSHGDEASNNIKTKIVSVVGAGGLGKTTLSKAVYDKLKVDFECTAFIPVGRDPDLKKVFRDLLIELDKMKYWDPRITILDERQLIDEIREYLGSNRYFIVIDDIWEINSWETIKLALVKNNNGSRLITTTRKLDVAIQADEFYELKPLPYEKSRKLFYKRICGGEGRYPDNWFDEVCDKILKKCGGVPLAIITMASLLAGKSREEWIEVCSAIAFRDKDNKQVSDTEWILSLSYYDLPPHLKTCLLYLSTFPEDHVIDKNPLIWKWVAEGFVQKEERTGLFEVGEGYFNELINRNMIQAVESEESGIVDGCRIHDMMLDFLRLKSQEENFLTVSNTNVEGTLAPRRVHRIAHQNRTVKLTHQFTQIDLGHVRTFVAFRCDIIDKGLSLLSFKLLRVLALEDSEGCSLRFKPRQHVYLIHLRYLRPGSSISELPEEVGALKFLQILDLEGTYIMDLPFSVGMLTQLICLRLKHTTMVPSGAIRKLTSLEELQVCVGDDTAGQFVKDLSELHELRVLKATFEVADKSMESDLECLGNLHKIQHLTLNCHFPHLADKALWDSAVLSRHIRHSILPYIYFSVLPSCINPSDLPILSHLDLFVRGMDEKGLKILGAFPELRHLKLATWSSMATLTFHAGDGCFQKLRSYLLPYSTVRFMLNEDSSVSFTIWYCERDDVAFVPKKWGHCILAPAVMPNLQVLYFNVKVKALVRNSSSCYSLGLECLPSLQKVRVRFNCNNVFADEAKKQEAELRHAITVHPKRPTLQIDIAVDRFIPGREEATAQY